VQQSCFNLSAYTCLQDGPDHALQFKAIVIENWNSVYCIEGLQYIGTQETLTLMLGCTDIYRQCVLCVWAGTNVGLPVSLYIVTPLCNTLSSSSQYGTRASFSPSRPTAWPTATSPSRRPLPLRRPPPPGALPAACTSPA
jgi:hypothetical protein